jgi:hypothetical protein
MLKNDEIVLMYSGGLDTTYIAVQLAKKYEKVHLLTFCNGFCVRPESSRENISILKDKFGAFRFEHSIIPIGDIFSFLRKNILKDMIRYRSPLLFDLCCRLSMETAMVLYCLDKKIKHAADGSNPKTQGQMFIQQEGYLREVDKFFSGFGIEIDRSYKMLDSRDDVTKELVKEGIDTGVKWLKYLGITTQFLTQPFCLWAPVAFLFTSDIRKLPFIRPFSLSMEKAAVFRAEKEKEAAKFINYVHYGKGYSISRNRGCVKKTAGIFKCAPGNEGNTKH